MMAVMLRPMFMPSRLRMNMAKMKPPPIMPGASAELNSHSMMTMNALFQSRWLSVNTLMRTMYAQSRMTTETIASRIQKLEELVQVMFSNARGSKSFKKSHPVTNNPMSTGQMMRFGEK